MVKCGLPCGATRSLLWNEGFVFTFQLLICALWERTLILLPHPPSLNLSLLPCCIGQNFGQCCLRKGGGKKAVEVTNKSTCMTHLLGFKTFYPSFKEPLLLFEGIRCLFLFFRRRMDWKLYIVDFFWPTADIIKDIMGLFHWIFARISLHTETMSC